MPIDSLCESCGRKLRVADEHAGKRAKCPSCGHQYVVPGASTAPTPAAAPTFQPQATSIPAAGPMAAAPAPYSAPTSDSRWRVRLPDGREYGPVSRAELDQWQAQGRVGPDCGLQQEGQTAWIAAVALYPALARMSSAAAFAPSPHAGGPAPGYGAPADGPFGSGKANPFADVQGNSGYSSPYPTPGYGTYFPRLEPNRGVLVLVLSIVSLFLCCPAISIAALIVGWLDLNAIGSGQMSSEGKGMVVAGMIVSCIQLAIFLMGIAVMVING